MLNHSSWPFTCVTEHQLLFKQSSHQISCGVEGASQGTSHMWPRAWALAMGNTEPGREPSVHKAPRVGRCETRSEGPGPSPQSPPHCSPAAGEPMGAGRPLGPRRGPTVGPARLLHEARPASFKAIWAGPPPAPGPSDPPAHPPPPSRVFRELRKHSRTPRSRIRFQACPARAWGRGPGT